ncbi:hypothetical protein QR680_001398 [Steinernema hermaphroditum]|uniref:Lipid-binding serum glycoprotein C-terminal domain-containing protein n=1 Tax=Steinernema hermaphroditum TaxID=289476 RepID=A0AA39LG08_9BILA|nr:hypothetical protein QR680_001398 [Steinernema hermaphroditum]
MMKYHHPWYCLPVLFALLHAHPFLGHHRHVPGIEPQQDAFFYDQRTSPKESLELFPEFEPAFDTNYDSFLGDFGDLFGNKPFLPFRPPPGGKDDIISDISVLMDTLLEDNSEEVEKELEEAKRKSKSVDEEFEEGTAGIAVRLTKHALLTAAQNITNFLVHDISRLSISDITLKSMDLNITLHGIKTHSYVPPSVDITVDGDIITLKTSKGSVKLFGQYTAVYKTIRQGVIEAKMSGFDLNLKLRLTKSPLGSLNVEVVQCASVVEHLHVDLIRHLLDQVTDDVRESLHKLSTAAICKYLNSYAQKVNRHLDSGMALKEIDIHSNVPQGQMQFDWRLSEKPELFSDYVDVPMPNKLMKRMDDRKRMIYIYMSDFIVNSFFFQLEAIADWKGKLHRVPEIAAALRLSCPETELCLGQYVGNVGDYVENSGRMYGKARDRPQVSLTDRGAHLKMNLSVELTYQPSNEMTPRTVARFHTDLKLHIDSFVVLTNEIAEVEGERRYRVNASGGIDELKLHEIEVFDENWEFCKTSLPSFVSQQKGKLETVLRQNLHTVFSISDGIIPVINSIDGHFRKRTLVVGLDIDMQSTISDFLELSDVFNY